MSHENLFTAKVGTLIPASVEEVLPGDIVSVGGSFSVELPPLATNFKGRIDAKLEAFFVPNRILWAGWKDFITQDASHAPSIPNFSVASTVPTARIPASNVAGTLADYLGVKSLNVSNVTAEVNVLPFAAYQKVWEDWYRDTNTQNPFFANGAGTGGGMQFCASQLPYLRGTGVVSGNTNVGNASSPKGINGKYIWDLNQRCFAKDYFTTMTTAPQAGAASELEFDVYNVSGTSGTTKFSIASLRAANSLQRWLERNNLAGTRYYDQILAHFGVLPPDANVDRAVLLGSMTEPVIVNSIAQTNANSTTGNTNPYGKNTGAMAGRALAFGKDRLINKFEVKEHGFIIILFSLVPHAYYGTGSRRYLSRQYSSDYAWTEFANIGDQEVYKAELYSPDIINGFKANIVGYNQRYSEYKYHEDEIHGKLAKGEDLASFAMQRGFTNTVAVNTALLEIPDTYLDDYMVADTSVSGFNAIVDAYFDAKYVRCLPEYSLPSLCHGE